MSLDPDDIENFRQERISCVKNQLDQIFGISDNEAKLLFENFKLESEVPKDELVLNILNTRLRNQFVMDGIVLNLSKDAGSMTMTLSRESNLPLSDNQTAMLSMTLMSMIYQQICCGSVYRPIMLPVERSSIYTFSKEIAQNRSRLVEDMNRLKDDNTPESISRMLKLMSERSSVYPMALAQLISMSSDMTQMSKSTGAFAAVADSIEHYLLHGHLGVSEHGDVVFDPDQSAGQIPISLGASVVKTLSQLVFLLRHKLQNGDLLIIDEPEINLHPDSQILMARIIARMVNAGLRVLISTHSDYIIRELNNLIMLSKKTDEISALMTRYGYAEDMPLRKSDIAVHLLDFDSTGRVTGAPVNVDDNGFEVAAFDRVINRLNEVSDEIYFALKYSGND